MHDSVKALADRPEVDPNTPSIGGALPLGEAARHSPGMMKTLLDAFPAIDVNALHRGFAGWPYIPETTTVLHIAAYKWSCIEVQRLLDIGADSTAKNCSGQMPEQVARDRAVAKLLAGHTWSKRDRCAWMAACVAKTNAF